MCLLAASYVQRIEMIIMLIESTNICKDVTCTFNVLAIRPSSVEYIYIYITSIWIIVI